MLDLAVLAEGETEARFVYDVLRPELAQRGISAWAVVLSGQRAWPRVQRDAERLLKERPGRICTTMIDFYARPRSWPAPASAAAGSAVDRVRALESAAVDAFSANHGDLALRFVPYLQLHEFEALLFSDCGPLSATTGIPADVLDGICQAAGGPELIDDGPTTAPSKRLDALSREHRQRGYAKTAQGLVAASLIPVSTMRVRCPHFDEWLVRLESFSRAS